ncbi:MAG: polyprenyl synthetase family protein [Betaproteobacteria bacterium]
MNPDLAFAVWSGERAARVAAMMDQHMPAIDVPPLALHAAMRYAALGAGKRVRALLAYAAGEMAGADPVDVDAAAAAVEFVHAYSLVHDDLPCMDDDVLRRGKPTVHIAFGETTALLAGDALQSLAFEILGTSANGSAATTGAKSALLANAVGSRGMAGGQALDLEAVGSECSVANVERIHELKTGALIRASVRLGAACGQACSSAECDALDRYACAIGLAFQVVDDVLDVEGTAQTLGKTAGKDAAQQKPTYVSLLGIDGAKARVDELLASARAELARFGARARRLREIADWIALRTN